LMRLRSNACLWSEPPVYSGRGRPRKHGQRIQLSDQTTWLEPDTGNWNWRTSTVGTSSSQTMA
jgi:hypothetical protein